MINLSIDLKMAAGEYRREGSIWQHGPPSLYSWKKMDGWKGNISEIFFFSNKIFIFHQLLSQFWVNYFT